MIKWLLKRLFALGLLGFGAVVLLLVCLSMEHYVPVELPKPTGSFAVGRVTREWIGRQDAESSTRDSKSTRPVFAWIWYPAANGASSPAPTQEYLPAPWRKALETSVAAPEQALASSSRTSHEVLPQQRSCSL